MHIPHAPAVPLRVRLLLTLAMVAVAAVFVAFAAPGTPASAAAVSAQDRVTHAIEHGTVAADVESGRLSSADLQKAASTGVTTAGARFQPWVDLSPAAASTASDLAAHDSSVQQTAASLRSAGVPAGAPDPAVSDHWWNRIAHLFDNHEYYISGVVVKTIITAGAGIYLAAVCISLDLSKLSCAALGVLVAGAAEFIKDGGCGRGYYFDFPDVWKSHCA